MRIRVHSLCGHAVLCAGLAAATSCSGPSGVSPTAPAPAALQEGPPAVSTSRVALAKGVNAIAADAAAFPLVAGLFAIANGDGDGIVGTYTGIAEVSKAAPQKSSLMLQILNGSGAFAGAVGTMAMTGVGSFADEGQFHLVGNGEVTLARGGRSVIVLNLRGTSVGTCSASGKIAISQTADGTMGRARRVAARLSHEVGNTGCDS